jgi:ABC-2 type transport system permease protein
MLFYLRLWFRFASVAFVREAEYRTNFAVNTLVSILSLVLAALSYEILYRFTPDVAGWSKPEALTLLGVFRLVEALIEMLVARNMWDVSKSIQSGDMDYLLLRPASSQFLATFQRINLTEGVNALIGIGLIAYALNQTGAEPSALSIGAALVMMLCGLVLLYAFWCASVTLAFWFQAGPLESLFHWFIDAGRYPVSFFKGWIRLFLTFVFPVAFASTFPTQALLGVIEPRTLLTGCLLSVLALWGANRFWNVGVRHYSSASS